MGIQGVRRHIAAVASVAAVAGLVTAVPPAVSATPERTAQSASRPELRAKKNKVKKASLRISGKRVANQRIRVTVRSNAKHVTFRVNGVKKTVKKKTRSKSRTKTFTMPASFNEGRIVTVRTVKTKKLRATKRVITVAKYNAKKDPAKAPGTNNPGGGDEDLQDWLKTPEGKVWIDTWTGTDSDGTPLPPGIATAVGDPAKEEAWEAQYVANYEAQNFNAVEPVPALTLSVNGPNIQITGIDNLPEGYLRPVHGALISIEERTNNGPWTAKASWSYPQNQQTGLVGTVSFTKTNGYQYRVRAVKPQYVFLHGPFNANLLAADHKVTPWSNIAG